MIYEKNKFPDTEREIVCGKFKAKVWIHFGGRGRGGSPYTAPIKSTMF